MATKVKEGEREMMLRSRLILAVSLAVLCFTVVPVSADMDEVYIDIDGTQMTVFGDTDTAVVSLDNTGFLNPTIAAWLLDGVNAQPLDVALINDGVFDGLSLELAFTESSGLWSATGQLVLEDATGAEKITASLDTYLVEIEGDDLTIKAALSPVDGPTSSILQPSSDPWVFEGNPGRTGALSDGQADQITVASHVADYDNGTVAVVHYTLGNGIGFAELFDDAATTVLTGGNVDIQIVPVPAAALLGVLGMGVAGLRLRKES